MGDGEGAEQLVLLVAAFHPRWGENGSASLNPLSPGHSCHLLLGAALLSANPLRLQSLPGNRLQLPSSCVVISQSSAPQKP